jgi:hypothetical protein
MQKAVSRKKEVHCRDQRDRATRFETDSCLLPALLFSVSLCLCGKVMLSQVLNQYRLDSFSQLKAKHTRIEI